MATTPKRTRALLMLVLSATLFGIMAFFAKLASAQLGGAQVAMVRMAIGLSPALLIPSFRRAAFTFTRVDLLFYRGFFGGLAVLFYFIAIEHIPVGIATLLNYTAPIFSGFFAAMFIGEKLHLRIIAPLAVAFTGVVLVVSSQVGPGHENVFGRWELLGLASAVLSGAAVTAIRMARRTESSWSIFASFSFFGLLATLPIAIPNWQNPTPREWGYLIIVGVVSIGAQLLLTSALRWIETVVAGVIAQFAVIVAMVLGAILLEETLPRLALIGSALTIAGVVAVMGISSKPRETAFDEAVVS